MTGGEELQTFSRIMQKSHKCLKRLWLDNQLRIPSVLTYSPLWRSYATSLLGIEKSSQWKAKFLIYVRVPTSFWRNQHIGILNLYRFFLTFESCSSISAMIGTLYAFESLVGNDLFCQSGQMGQQAACRTYSLKLAV
jgi:hypothetical protein